MKLAVTFGKTPQGEYILISGPGSDTLQQRNLVKRLKASGGKYSPEFKAAWDAYCAKAEEAKRAMRHACGCSAGLASVEPVLAKMGEKAEGRGPLAAQTASLREKLKLARQAHDKAKADEAEALEAVEKAEANSALCFEQIFHYDNPAKKPRVRALAAQVADEPEPDQDPDKDQDQDPDKETDPKPAADAENPKPGRNKKGK